MTEKPYEEPVTGEVVEPDPKKPAKAITAALVPAIMAFLYAVLDARELLPPWLAVLITAVLAGLATFTVKNPQRRRVRQRR